MAGFFESPTSLLLGGLRHEAKKAGETLAAVDERRRRLGQLQDTPVETDPIIQEYPRYADKIANARSQGFSDDEIVSYLTKKRVAAYRAGFSKKEVDVYVGKAEAPLEQPLPGQFLKAGAQLGEMARRAPGRGEYLETLEKLRAGGTTEKQVAEKWYQENIRAGQESGFFSNKAAKQMVTKQLSTLRYTAEFAAGLLAFFPEALDAAVEDVTAAATGDYERVKSEGRLRQMGEEWLHPYVELFKGNFIPLAEKIGYDFLGVLVDYQIGRSVARKAGVPGVAQRPDLVQAEINRRRIAFAEDLRGIERDLQRKTLSREQAFERVQQRMELEGIDPKDYADVVANLKEVAKDFQQETGQGVVVPESLPDAIRKPLPIVPTTEKPIAQAAQEAVTTREAPTQQLMRRAREAVAPEPAPPPHKRTAEQLRRAREAEKAGTVEKPAEAIPEKPAPEVPKRKTIVRKPRPLEREPLRAVEIIEGERKPPEVEIRTGPKGAPSYPREIETYLELLRDEVAEGEAGRRIFDWDVEGEGGAPQVRGRQSTFPEFMKNKGWTKDEVLGALDKLMGRVPKGKTRMVKMQAKQVQIAKDAIEYAREAHAAEYESYKSRLEEEGFAPRQVREAENALLQEARAEAEIPPEELERRLKAFEEPPPEEPHVKEIVPPETRAVIDRAERAKKRGYVARKLREEKGAIGEEKSAYEALGERFDKIRKSRDAAEQIVHAARRQRAEKVLDTLEAGEAPDVSHEHLVRMGFTEKAAAELDAARKDLQAGKPVDTQKLRQNVYKIELMDAIEDSAADKAVTPFLKTGRMQSFLDAMPDIGMELTLKEILSEAKEVRALRKSGFYVGEVFIDTLKDRMDRYESQLRDYNEGRLKRRPKHPDIPKSHIGSVDPTRLIQEIDGGVHDGPVSRFVLYPTRRTTMASLLFSDLEKVRVNALLSKYKIKRRRDDRLAGDVIEAISKEEASAPISELLEKPEIKKHLAGLDRTIQKRVVGFARDARPLYDRWIDLQNAARKKRNQPEIPYRQQYRQWVRERNVISSLIGWVRGREGIIDTAEMPDFVQPNQPPNPRAMRRYGGEFTKERRLSRLLAQYVDTAARDIFNTNIIHNNKIHAKALRELGYENAAAGIEQWTAEGFAGVPHRISKALHETVAHAPLKAIATIRRNLTAAVFPLNWSWNIFIQTSSAGLTFMRYGSEASIAGLRYFYDKSFRELMHRNAYGLVIKKRWGGRQLHQDVGESIAKMRRLEAGPVDNVIHYMSFLTQAFENALTGHAIAAAYHFHKKGGLSGRALWEAASDGAQTQSFYNLQDLPGFLRSKDLTALVPFQTFAAEVMNMVRELDLPVVSKITGRTGAYRMHKKVHNRLLALGRWAVAMGLTNAIVDRAIGREPWQLSSFVPFSSVILPSNMQFGMGGATLPAQYVGQLYTGMERVIKYGDWRRLRAWAIRYHVPGGVQMERTIRGLEAIAEDGVYDVRGRPMYSVMDEEARAILLDPRRTKKGMEYYKEREPDNLIDLLLHKARGDITGEP